MLTHLHMVVYTGGVGTLCKGGEVPRVERGVGSFGAFEKIKCIFSIAPVGNLEKSQECFSTGRSARRHRTLTFSVRCAVGCSRVHRTHRRESGAQRPVCGRFGDPLYT